MVRRHTYLALAVAAVGLGIACSQEPQSPVSPTGASGAANAAADGSTLKVTAPTLLGPIDGQLLETRRPVFNFQNSTGRFTSVPVVYRLEVLDATGQLLGARAVNQNDAGTTVFQLDVDLGFGTDYQWRVRAEFEGQIGPWSAIGTFKTPAQPVAGGPITGNVGPERKIGFNEAFGIIINIHDTLRVNLSGSSTREYRVDFLNAAVAAIYYGHPRFNAAGPDPNWCVKDAGGGRPQSDDALVYCPTREAWDLIVGSGGNGYRFDATYLGPLPNVQNVYPPPRSALSFLGQ